MATLPHEAGTILPVVPDASPFIVLPIIPPTMFHDHFSRPTTKGPIETPALVGGGGGQTHPAPRRQCGSINARKSGLGTTATQEAWNRTPPGGQATGSNRFILVATSRTDQTIGSSTHSKQLTKLDRHFDLAQTKRAKTITREYNPHSAFRTPEDLTSHEATQRSPILTQPLRRSRRPFFENVKQTAFVGDPILLYYNTQSAKAIDAGGLSNNYKYKDLSPKELYANT
ncbi:hypothetical protein SAMD00023353_0902000 [Rosellinia necatrix]|uniref:Uncharacterized protein n=1 Tax=Rosellinia necatrix TaxID=77044 RepID=A0A1S8A6H2_ROSNE|nr:hypothetical protein SAMD00023353_0902000 [Rosellinia necatrix]